jgi:hypothetical protein
MSDFDTVLERLLADPSFAAALSADPAGVLAGYRLSADEAALLHSQVTGDAGGQSAVETRANQSSAFGLLTPLAGLAGAAEAFGQIAPAQQGFGAAPAQQGFGAAPAYEHGFGAPAAQQGFGSASAGGAGGSAAAVQGFGPAAPVQGFGPAAPVQGFGPADAVQGFGPAGGAEAAYTDGLAPADPPAGLVGGPGGQFGSADDARNAGPDLDPPEGYRTRVDVDGDGSWDRHTLRGDGDGGVDILVDANSDGQVDFIGHDTDADGLVDSAEYDKNRDGFFEKRSYDDDGDGWLDRSETRRPPAVPDPPAGAD